MAIFNFSLPSSALTALAGDATSQRQLFARGIRGAICWFNPGTLVLLRPGKSSAKPLLPNYLNQTRYPWQNQGQRI